MTAKHGWYSEKHANAGTYFISQAEFFNGNNGEGGYRYRDTPANPIIHYETPTGEVVAVTMVTDTAEHPDTGWDDLVYVGEVTKHVPTPRSYKAPEKNLFIDSDLLGEIKPNLSVAKSADTPKGVVIYHDEMGVFLGHSLGLGFFSNMDPVGQTSAVAFKDEQDAREFIAECDDFPSDVKFRTVVADANNGEAATIQACIDAGLPGWDPEANNDLKM